MLVKGYRWEFIRPPNPQAVHLRGVAHLDNDISAILPQLNTVLQGHQYFAQPPSLTLKYQGKLITLSSRQIAINILQDEEEAEQIIHWLLTVINQTWEQRQAIEPTYTVSHRADTVQILKLLPRTNCGHCGYPTCLALAVQINEGRQALAACPHVGAGSVQGAAGAPRPLART